MRLIHQGMRGIVYLLAVLAILTVGIASMRFAPALHATASHAVSHTQLAETCTSSYGHC